MLLDKNQGACPTCMTFVAANYSRGAEVVKALIEAGAETDLQDINDSTALIEAVKMSDKEIAYSLVHAGANTQIKDNLGNTAFDYARSKDMTDILNKRGWKPLCRDCVKSSKSTNPLVLARVCRDPACGKQSNKAR